MSQDLYTEGLPHMPFARGPHCVSSADLCTDGNDSSLIRLFYPTASEKGSHRTSPRQWTRWYLGDQHNDGFVQFITSSATYSRFILPAMKPFLYLYGYYLTKDVKVPVAWCKGLLPRAGSAEGIGGWPVVIASHGMATHRSSLSTLSSDLASHGFVVAAIEHREGSASASFDVDPKSKEKQWKKYTGYIHNGQLDNRVDEIFNAASILKRLNAGEVEENLLEGESPFPRSTFKGHLDLSNAVAIGHSYGGVSVLKALADARNQNGFRCGIVLDPWMFPVRTSGKELGQSIKDPLLSISTQQFNRGPNQRVLRAFQQAHGNAESAFHTMAGTCHHHGNDAPWISGRFGWWVTGGTSSHHPQTIHKLQCSLILTFIDKHIDTIRDNLYCSHTWIPRCSNFIKESSHIIMSTGDDERV